MYVHVCLQHVLLHTHIQIYLFFDNFNSGISNFYVQVLLGIHSALPSTLLTQLNTFKFKRVTMS